MPRKSLKKTFNVPLRKKRCCQEDEELSEQDSEPSLILLSIASRRHARNAKVRCIKSLSTIIRDEERFELSERARARVANESEEQRQQRFKVMRRLSSKRLAAERSKRRQQRLQDQRRRAAQRTERESRRKEQKRTALRLSYLPTYKSAVSPIVVLDRLKLNTVGDNNSMQQQQSVSTNSTNDDSGQESNSPLEDNDDDVDHVFKILFKVERDLDDEWELEGDGLNNEESSSRSRQVATSNSYDIDTSEQEEEPLDDEFNNIVLERTVLMMCRDD